MKCATCGKAIDSNHGATLGQAKYIHTSVDADDVDHDAVPAVEPSAEETLKSVKEGLQLLLQSCREGQCGSWDCTTDEGREGFDAMADGVLEIAKVLGLELEDPGYGDSELEDDL